MGRRAASIMPTEPTPPGEQARLRRAYQDEIAKLRRFRTALLQTCSDCEDYIAHADDRRAQRPDAPPR